MDNPIDMNVHVLQETSVGFLKSMVFQRNIAKVMATECQK